MSALLNQPLSADMGHAVIDFLKAITPLPDRGIVAGQAVTSALLHLYGDGTRRGPINDIDIFLEDAKFKDELKMHFSLDRFFLDGNTKDYFQERGATQERDNSDLYSELSLVPNVTARKTLNITRVEREGLLNSVAINPTLNAPNSYQTGLSAARVINSFDINCVEAGVNLATGKLSWSKNFNWFLKTSQLQQTNVHGEVHTMLRMLKKMKEMPWIYCDMPSTARSMMFTHHLKVELERASGNPDLKMRNDGHRKHLPCVPVMGPAYLLRFKEFESEITPWFKLSDKIIKSGRQELYLTEPTYPLDAPEFKAMGNLHAATQKINALEIDGYAHRETKRKALMRVLKASLCLAPELAYSEGLVSGLAIQKRESTLTQAGRHFVAMQKAKNITDIAKAKQRAEQRAEQEGDQDRAERHVQPPLEFIAEVDNLFTQKMHRFQGDRYLQGQVDLNSTVALESFLSSHNTLRREFAPLSLQDQVQAMKNLKDLDHEFKGVAIGLLESLTDSIDTPYPETLASKDLLRAHMKPIIDNEMLPMDIAPLGLKQSYAGVRVKELMTNMELKAEGARMSHCVGGYSPAVRSGNCRIVSFTSGPSKLDSSTLDFRVRECEGVLFPYIRQHRGFANDKIPDAHVTACQHLINEMAKRLVEISFQRQKPIDKVSLIKSHTTPEGLTVDIQVEPMTSLDMTCASSRLLGEADPYGSRGGISINKVFDAQAQKPSEMPQWAILSVASTKIPDNLLNEGGINARIAVSVNSDGSINWPFIESQNDDQTRIRLLHEYHQGPLPLASMDAVVFKTALEVFKLAQLSHSIDSSSKVSSEIEKGTYPDIEVQVYLNHPQEREPDLVVINTSPLASLLPRAKALVRRVFWSRINA